MASHICRISIRLRGGPTVLHRTEGRRSRPLILATGLTSRKAFALAATACNCGIGRDWGLISLFRSGLVHRAYCETDISALLLDFPFMVIVRVWSPVGNAGT